MIANKELGIGVMIIKRVGVDGMVEGEGKMVGDEENFSGRMDLFFQLQ